jgi:hypothetical protein
MQLDIRIEGKEEGDIELALEEVLKKVQEGYTSGADRNETGQYYFDLKGKDL